MSLELEHVLFLTEDKDYKINTKIILSNKIFLKEVEVLIDENYPKNINLHKAKKIFKKFGYNFKYLKLIIDYLKDSLVDVELQYDKLGLEILAKKSSKSEQFYYLKVGPNTRIKDLEKAYKLMSDYFKELKTKRNRKKQFLERNEEFTSEPKISSNKAIILESEQNSILWLPDLESNQN